MSLTKNFELTFSLTISKTMVGIALVFIALGILIKYGKMYFLIAGYNTLSNEEQLKFKIEEMATLYRNVMLGMGIIIITGGFIADYQQNPAIEKYTFFGALAIGILYLLVRSNSKKKKKNQ